MLSILIPTYNYNTYSLILELQRQCNTCNFDYEILCLDDASNLFNEENQRINSLTNCYYSILEKNIGRSAIRNLLAEKAKNEWLLFLDSDVMPTNSNFISNYLDCLNLNHEIILGGYKYQNHTPRSTEILRYKYGKSREEKSALERNLNPYKSIFSGNLSIKKKLFLTTNYSGPEKIYGMDIYFSYQLFKNKIAVLHIDNPIFHLGLENNEQFFNKSLESVRSRKEIMINLEGIEEINPLIKYYKLLNKYRLTRLYKMLFKPLEPLFKKNILSNNPNLLCFDLYRLGYICNLEPK